VATPCMARSSPPGRAPAKRSGPRGKPVTSRPNAGDDGRVDDEAVAELLAPYEDARRDTAHALRSVVRRAIPNAIEAVRPGWHLIGYNVPAGRRAPYFGFIWAEPEHVHLGFEYGTLMDDPHGVLEGGFLRKVRYVTLRSIDDFDENVLVDLVREAARVALLGRAERVAIALDRDDPAGPPRSARNLRPGPG
jgi:hypothetical protein